MNVNFTYSKIIFNLKRKKNKVKNVQKKKIFLKLLIISIICFLLYLILLIQNYYLYIRHPEDIFSPHKVFIESHRGVNREIFQNTIEAFKRAIQYKIEGIETDVWLTKDNELVIMHGTGPNGNLEGFYNHPGNITDLTWEELSKFKTVKDNLTIPKLRDVMKLIKNKIYMNLEIKDPRIDLIFPYIVKLIEEFDLFEQINLSSYEQNYYYKVQEYNNKYNKSLVFGSLYKSNYTGEYNYTRKGSSLNIYWKKATKEVCDRAHENGMAVLTFFKMNDTESYEIYKELIENGVDVICCNEPVLAKTYRDIYYIKSNINKILFKFIINIKNYFTKYS